MIDLRIEHECRIQLGGYLRKHEILYGKVSPYLLIAISDFLLEWECEHPLSISVINDNNLTS